MKDKIDFLYQAISDTQATIRAIDVKLGFLFVVAFMPLTILATINNEPFIALWNTNCIYKILFIITLISWISSIFYLFFALTAISNPRKVLGEDNQFDIFYGKDLFSRKIKLLGLIVDFELKDQAILSNPILESDDSILKELISEKIKINYIREKKLAYYLRGTWDMYIWLTSCLIIYLIKVFFSY